MLTFKDKNLTQKFNRDGYVKISLLDANEVAELNEFYQQKKSQHWIEQDILHSTCDTGNLDMIVDVNKKLQSIIIPKLEQILDPFDALLASFLVKESGEKNETGFHQDPTFVDESQYQSGNVWVSLQDCSGENGNLRVIKGSHRLLPILRVTPYYPPFYADFEQDLNAYATEVPVKAGEAVIFTHQLIHGATTNSFGKERIAAVMAIKSKLARWNFYYKEPENSFDKIEKYNIDFDSFSQLVKNERPEKGEFVEYVSYNFEKISYDHFKNFMHENYPTEMTFKKMKRFLKKIF